MVWRALFQAKTAVPLLILRQMRTQTSALRASGDIVHEFLSASLYPAVKCR